MNNYRLKILNMAYAAKEGHIASSLSILDILYVLYHKILNIENIKNLKPDRDRFVLSKGHASLALYVILNSVGLIDNDIIKNYCCFDGLIGGHPKRNSLLGIEASTGSLGHGLPISVGIALGYKIKGYTSRIYTLIGDGELNEGSMWESLLLANHHKLNNLTIIVDYNHSGDRALKYNELNSQFKSFGCYCFSINGHNHYTIENALKEKSDRPLVIIANTIKGYGVKRMENNPEWHHRQPSNLEFEEITKELK
jgi:transketolase